MRGLPGSALPAIPFSVAREGVVRCALAFAVACSLPPAAVHARSQIDDAEPRVTAQGMICAEPSAGDYTLTARAYAGDPQAFRWDLQIRMGNGIARTLPDIEGNAFFLSNLHRVIALHRLDTDAVLSPLRVYDLDGRVLYEGRVDAPVNPALSPDGTTLAWTGRGELRTLDLRDFRVRCFPHLDCFAPAAGGRVVGISYDQDFLHVFEPDGAAHAVSLPTDGGFARRVEVTPDGNIAFVLLSSALLEVELPSGPLRLVFAPSPGTELRDLALRGDDLLIGLRRVEPDRFVGTLAVLDRRGSVRRWIPGPAQATPRYFAGEAGPTDPRSGGARDEAAESDRGILWPLAPNSQHPVGNTYAEYQYYGGEPYLHPGIDVMGTGGQAVYAVRNGIVKAILTTSGEWHWRVAIADTSGSAARPGYLYAHLDPGTIAVSVGQTVVQGQYLGDLVTWPVADFHHCHFTRIEDSGVTWDGSWLSIHNPHLDLPGQSETDAPFFLPARGTDLLAFCADQTSSYQIPHQLHGTVDIIAHVGDRIESNWVCTVQELRYTIYPFGQPDAPLVDDKLAQRFDMTLDNYAGGQNDAVLLDILFKDDVVCNTQGDYDDREFYHIVTNSDGDGVYEESDLFESWDTSELPDDSYVIRVTAIDARGNASSDSMVVTTVNGNPSAVPSASADEPRLLLEPFIPNPLRGSGSIRVRLPVAGRITLACYNAAGRHVRRLHQGLMRAGAHEIRWDGCDDRGRPVPAGAYFVRLVADPEGARSEKVLVLR